MEKVPRRRGNPGYAFGEDVKDQAFVLYATVTGHNAAATARIMATRAEDGEATPTMQTIQKWANDEDWMQRSDDLWRTNNKAIIWAYRRKAAGNAFMSQDVKGEAMTGGLDHLEPWQAAIRLKGAELTDRVTERIVGLTNLEPPKAPREDESHLSLHEQEARANARLVEAQKRSIG